VFLDVGDEKWNENNKSTKENNSTLFNIITCAQIL
jgi:hypothetical protein